jgi:adenine-specific DNA-methyltransferase
MTTRCSIRARPFWRTSSPDRHFGEPDIDLINQKDDTLRVKVNGVDVFKPQSGEVISDNADGIACWFIDTDYNEESFFVRHAYFLGANDPYSALKTTLKAEIDAEAWESLHSDTSRPFDKPKSGRIVGTHWQNDLKSCPATAV